MNTRTFAPAIPYLHMLQGVEITPLEPGDDNLVLMPVWRDVDRTRGTGIAFRPAEAALAERLKALILQGGAYSRVEVLTDVEGHTYVSTQERYRLPSLKSDLAALGA